MVGTEKKPWRFNAVNDARKGMRDDNVAKDTAQQNMRETEDAAAQEVAQTTDDTDGARAAEDVDPINYVGGGGDSGDGKKKKGKGLFKRKGAIGFILAMLFGSGGLMLGSQSLMPFSLSAQLRETFDTIKTSNEIRNKTMWRLQLNNKEIIDPVHKKWFGFGGDTFKVRSKQKSKLKTQGIYVQDVEVEGGKTKTIMLFDDGSGKLKIVAPSDSDISVLKRLDVNSVDLKGIDADIDLSGMKIDTDDVVSFDKAFDEIADFRNGYIKGSRTWRGSVKAWFDSVAYRFLQSNKITRNLFKKFQERVAAEQAGNTHAAAKKATTDIMESGNDGTVRMQTTTVDADEDEDGNVEITNKGEDGEITKVKGADGEPEVDPHVGTTVSETADGVKRKTTKFELAFGASRADIKAKMDEIKNSKLGKASGYVSAVVNIACAVFDVIGAVNLLIAAQETIQVVQVVTGFLEAVDKAKAGDGDGSPINVLAEGLTTPSATTIMQNTTYDRSALEGNEDIDIEEKIADGKESTTAMQSSGIASLYGGGQVDTNDASVQNFAIGSRFSSILGYLTTSVQSFATCALAKAAAAVAGVVTDIIAIVSCAASFGIGCVVDAIAEGATSAGASAAIAIGANLAINYLTPLAVQAFTRTVVSNLVGEDFGNALVSGANIYMGQNHLQGGGSLTTRDKYPIFALKQQEVIAEEARYERETRDPFDITSQYTFAGSLLKQVATLNTMPSSIFGVLGSAARMVSNSVTALLPSASAYDISEALPDEKQYEKNCPYLASIGAVGDAFCNPYIVTDMSTIEMDPETVANNIDGLDDNGEIIKGSNLSNYVLYCSQRSSTFGVADSNIASAFDHTNIETGNTTANTVLTSVVSAIPVVGDALDIVGNSEKLANTGWITGQSCVASNDEIEAVDGGGNKVVLGASWEENKYYQRFIEDQRLLEGLDDNYTSVVTSFLDKYYEENPLDNSYEGILARKSGLTKDEVIAVLDLIEYWDYIANYDPTTRYQMGEEPVVAKKIDFGGEVIAESKTVILTEVPVWDRRQRAIAVA